VFVEDSGVRILASKGQLLDTQVRKDGYVNIPACASAGQVSHLLLDGRVCRWAGRRPEDPAGSPHRHRVETFAGWQGEGSTCKGRVDLDIPLAKGVEPKIVVDFKHRQGAPATQPSPSLELNQLKGDFRFDSTKGLSGQGISARAFDRPITAQIAAGGKPGQSQHAGQWPSGQVTVKKPHRLAQSSISRCR
jgi:uncharacterized protein YhdP